MLFRSVLLEAMQAELPIIAANNSAIPEVLGNDHPGLYSSSELLELVSKLRLTQNINFRNKIIDFQSRRLRFFDPERMSNEIGNLYQSVIEIKH